ncbi:unnamed protein product [Onchocerca ochengi]|uniref:Protein-tyrosine-phosphatase n=1 Tax=Onchocerca ochengi TaxID=42157 RepID=A0A182E0B1_ONCOC|nr:unnamed protein product [Onchocerca ochengi]
MLPTINRVTAPPFPPPEAGQCHFSTESGREICWPRYEDLDTTCTDVGSGMVSAPAVKHAAIRAMAFVPPDNLRRLVRQYYRQKGLPVPQNATFSKNSFLFALYECDYGYEFVDEVNSMFCINRQWVITSPKCRGKGLCEADNGGCSHSCLSIEDREVECHCPHGLVLDSDKKTCIKPIPKNLCRILNSCSCTAIDENQYSCTCPKGEKCLLLRGQPKIYIEPAAPYEIMPGGNLNITCSAVAYPFPQIFWQRGDETVEIAPVKPGTVRSEQILIIKELYKNTQFTCHANNSLGQAERTIEIVVTGPGSAPIIRGIDAGRSSVHVRWDPPVIINRPVTSYTVYYTSNGQQPIKNWKKINVDEPNREVTIKDLRPNTQYFIRLRANDKLGPGRLSNPVSVNTRKPATRPQLFIQQGDTINVPPLKKFSISCNVTRGDPSPKIAWYTRARPINKPQRKKFITMEHGGLYESTNFSCVAENEAGRTTKRIQVIVTGPTSPERIRYQIHGNNVDLQWEPPRITNGQLKDYEVLYTDNPSLPEEYWEVAKAGSPDARSLQIPNLKEKQDYTFKIRAQSDLGPGLFSDQFTLTTWLAARPPVVTITPAEKIVKDPSNEELVFECEAIGVPRPKILWLWSGGLVEDGKNEFRIYDVTPPDAQDRSNSKLIAEKTNRAGVATCQAVNAHGSDEKRTEVKIVGPGSPPRDISTVPFTNSFQVSWNPPKYPNGKITRYIIYYTKNPDDALGDWETTSVEGDQLEVTIPADEDTPYNVRVQAATKDGLGIVSEVYDVTTGKKPIPLSVKLVVLDPQVREGDTETIVEPRQTIIFKCDAKGRPAPQISYTWLPFNDTESGQEPTPIPAYSDPQEAHRYHSLDVNTNTATKRALMCSARNVDGSVSDRHIFNVIKPGSPPENVQAIIDPDNRVTISWQEPKYPNGPIIKYKVYVTSDPAEPISNWQIYDAEPSEAPNLILERGELQPETPYYVKIAAVGQGGEGLQSDVALFETVSGGILFLMDSFVLSNTVMSTTVSSALSQKQLRKLLKAPIDAPKDVLATVEQDNTMNISWTGPSVPNGPIQACLLESYTVYFTPLDQHQTSDDAYKQWDKIVVQSNDDFGTLRLNKDIYDILPNRLYRIRVSATNDQSEGPASEPITVRTESGETPPIIRLEPGDNPATVAPYGSISVRCTATGIPPPNIMWIIGTNASDVIRGPILQLTDLRKDETATCKAENNAGQTQEVLQILVAGPGSPPNEIVALPLDNQQVNIEWTTPDNPNGKITDYIIHYGEILDGETIPPTWETVRVSADEPQKYRLTDLKPKTNYAIRLQAISDRGRGVLSDPIKVTTLPLAPAMVQPADVKVHDNNTVAIQFQAPRDPEDPEKPIKEFVVHYTDDDPSSDDAEWKEMSWTEPDDDFSVNIPIGGEHFKPDTKYSIKITARGEIDSPPSEPVVFQTGDGIVPPEKPQINVDVPDNVIRVPAGSDYTVGCSSSGFPPPRIFWPLSDGPMLRLQDVKETVKAKCVAENEGGRAETDFEIFVTGPGNAPSNIRLNSLRPRTIHIDWDPPTIPNGNITRYIIYYTPLDDQASLFCKALIYQMGQIPKKPITEWMTFHKDSEPLMGLPQRADLVDFIEPDTAYAVVLQAVNQDGPGPYSEQHTIRTMSRAREGPPLDLKVEPEGQRSANVEWQKPVTSEQPPIGYELYYIKADAKIWENDLASIDDWNMIPITEKDGDKLFYKIDGLLEPDTEYVFRMRAVYPDGPGVFSDACITKTLPDGNAPYILISNGDHGVEGKTEITILPGSALDLSCNATGQPRPAVKWIRSGYYPIDPAWVKADEKYAVWFLKVSNITEDTSFNCVAQSPLGFANWTISVRLAPDLPSTWKNDFIIAKNENGEVVLHFTDDLPDYLKEPQNPWNIYWTDNPSKPFETWNLIPFDNRPLDRVAIPEMEPGAKYHLLIEQPSAGIKTPVFEIMTPKPVSDIRVGTDINGETVLDFKPALATEPIKKYIIKYWPDNNPSAVMYMETPVNVTDKIVLDGLQPDTDYNFMVSAKFDSGDNLPSEPVKIRTPSGDIQCHCAHACMFEEDEEGVITASCYCHNGFKLSDDQKSCEPIEEYEEAGIVKVTPPTLVPEFEYPKELSTRPTHFDDLIPTSEKFDKMEILEPKEDEEEPTIEPLPTDEYGRAIIWQQGELVTTEMSTESISGDISPESIDSEGQQERVLSPIVSFDGTPLPTNEYGQTVDNLGNPISWDDEGRPIGPHGIPLSRNDKGEYIYPILGKNGEPLPTDINMKPIYPIVGPDDQPFQKNREGLHIDQYGQIVPTDSGGHPVSVDGSPYPTDEQGRYIVVDSKDVIQQAVPTDELGRIIFPVLYPDGILLSTMEDGRFVDEDGQLIPTNDVGMPVNEQDQVLPKDSAGNFIYEADHVLPTDSNGQPVRVQYDGKLLKNDKMGRIIGPDGQVVPVNDDGHPVDDSNVVFSTTSDGIFVLPVTDGRDVVVPEKEQKKGVGKALNIIGPNGQLLPTMEDGTVLDPFGKTIPTNNIGEPVNYRNEPLPTNSEGQAIYPKDGLDCPLPPTDQHGRPVYSVVGPDGRLLPRKQDGTAVDPDGNLLPTNAAGVPVDRKGRPLPTDKNGSIIYPARGIDAEPLPTDSNGKPVYSIIGLDGNLLPTDRDGRVVDEDGRPLPTNAAGVPVNEQGEPLPIDQNGYIRYPGKTERQEKPEYTILGIHGEPLPRNEDGLVIGPDNRPVPTDASGYPVDYRGRPLLRDRNGNIIYPANGLDAEPVPTDRNGRPAYLVIGPNGQLFSRDSDGAVIDTSGQPIPTNAAGVPLDQYGRPIPVDRNGYVFYPKESDATDKTSVPIYTILGPDGTPLKQNADGAIVDPYGRPIPTNPSGYPTDNYGRPLPRDRMGNFIYPIGGLDVEPPSTDANGLPSYPVIGPNGELLPRGYSGEVLDPDGRPIPTNAVGIPINNLGEPLPRDKSGNVIYPAGGLDVPLLPTDGHGRPIYEIIDSNGELLPRDSDGINLDQQGKPIPTNAAGVPVDQYGRPLQQTDTGKFIYPADEIYGEEDKSEKQSYSVIGPDRELLPQNDSGTIVDLFGRPIPTSEDRTRLDVGPMPTDRSGKPVYPIIGFDGHLLPTTADGDIIGPDGNIVPVNAAGVPTNRRGEPLPRDKYGNFIYPATGLDVELPPTDKSGKIVYPVVDLHGEPLSTNEDGAIVDFNGYPIPTNEVGVPVDEYGKSLPKDAKGNFIFGIPIRPTDQRGLPINAVIGPDGELLPTDESGRVIGPDGHPISVDSEGKPINIRGEPLPTDRSGNFIYPFKGLDAELLPTDSNGLPIYSVVDSYGQVLPTNDKGLAVDDEGKPLPTNAAGVPIDDHGKPLPTDSNGNLVYGKVQKPLSVDESDQLIYPVIEPDSELRPTEKIDAVVVSDAPTDRIGLDIESLPTDSNGRRVYPVIGANQELLPTNEDGAVVDKNGNVIPTNADGVPVDKEGVSLPTDASGKVIYQESAVEAYPTDRLGRRIYKVIGPDGNYLPVDIDGGVLDPQGRPIPTDESGNLIDIEGKPLPKDRYGNIIYIAKPLPTDQNGKPIYPIIGPDKVPLPTNEEGRPVDEEGKPIPTNAAGMPVDNYGKPLPTDVEGNLHYITKAASTASIVVPGLPVIGPEGVPLPTSSNGSIFGPDGKVLVTDQNGWPLDEEGKPMPTDIYNNIIYPIRLPDGSTLPTDSHGRPVYPVIGPDGELLPTTESGLVIGLDGSPLSTNAAGKPVGPDASPLPTDEEGRVIYLPPEASSSTFATNGYGQVVYPIVDTDGKPLNKDDSGAYITRDGIPVELNEYHLPVDPDGNVLPTDSRGNYIFPDLDVMGKMLPTDKAGRAVYPVIGPNGQLLATDSSGAIIGPDGELLPTNEFGKPVGLDGKPLPTDNEGRFVYSEVAETDFTKKMIINVVDDRGRPLPTDELGRYLIAPNYPLQQDDTGRLIGPDGEPLPTDDSGNYVYRDKTKYPSDDFGRPLPTDKNGFYMRKDDSIITTELPMDEQGVVLPTDELGMRTKFPAQTKSYQILDEKNQLMPTDEAGNFLDHEGHPIAENEDGKPISADGVVLPTTDIGYYIFDTIRQKPVISTGKSMQDIYEIEGKLLPVDEDDHRILPTDEYGRLIYPVVKPDGEPYPTDRGQRPIYPVIGPDGKFLPTSDEGLALDIRGDPIPTNSIGRPLDEDGVMLPIDSEGNAVYSRRKQCDTHMGVMDIAVMINVETLSPDSFEHVKRVIQNLVNEYFDLAPDMTQFAVIKYSGGAEIPITLGGYNEKMQFLEELGGLKIDHMKENPRLTVGVSAAKQQFISFGRDYAGKLMIVITDGQDVYPKNRLNDDNIPMLVVGIREFEEEIKDWTKSYILIDSWEQLRADSIVKMIEKECSLGRISIPLKKAYRNSSLSTDEIGRILVVPTSERIIPRRYTDYQRSSHPFNSDDNIMIAKRTGKITHTTDSTRSFLYPVIDPDNIPKDASDILRTDNKLLSTAKKSLSLTSATDTNFHRRPLYSLSDQMLSSGEYNRIYFKGPVGEPRTTYETGNFISNQNRLLPIEIDQSGKPVGAETRSDQIQKERKATVVDLFGKPLPTNKYGDSIYADGSVLSTDSSRQSIGRDGSLMPVNDRGRYVSDYVPNRIVLQESELLAEASRCDKIEETANIIFIVESSNATRMKLNKIKLSLLNFIKKSINWRIAKVGMVSYGTTVDVILDIGNYQSYDDLKESILNLPVIGGTASGDEHAFRTALQLFREKYNNDNGELIVHIFNTPLSKDAQVIANHLKVNETISILSLGPDQWYRLERDKEIKKLRSDMCLMLMKSHLAQSKKPDDELKDKMKSGDGSVTFSSMTPSESEMTGKSLSRDENGYFLHSVVSPDDQLLPTDSSGAPTDSFGRFILHDNVGTSIGPDGRPLSKADQSRYMYPAFGISGTPLPTDVNKRPIYSVKGSDGQPLPTDRTGRAIDSSGKLIPTDEGGKPIGSNGSVLPTDINGWFLLAEEEIGRVLSVDRDIIGSKRKSLLTSSSDLSGKATPMDKYGRLVDVDGLSLTTDSSGKFLLESQTKKTLSGDKYSQSKYSETDQSSLSTDSFGILLNSLGMPISTDDTGKPLSPDGKVLPMDKYGRYIYGSVGQDRRIFSTKKLKGPIYSTRQTIMLETVIPTDDQGFYIYPAFQPDKMLPSPDAQKKLPITAMGGRSLSTDSRKNIITPNGKSTSMSDFEQTSKNDDSQLLTDEDKIFMFGKEKKPLHSTVKQDGKLLSADQSAHYLDSRGEGSVAITDISKIYPSNNNKNILSTMSTNDLHVYPAIGPDERLPSSIENSRPVYTEVDSHGQRQPINERTSMILESRRLPIRIDEYGKPVGLNDTSLRIDEFGRYVFGINDRERNKLSIDKIGHSVYPVVDSDGKFLSTNSIGRPIPTDKSGLSIDGEGHIVPTDGAKNYLYPDIGSSRRILHRHNQSVSHRNDQSIFTGQNLKTISDRFVSATFSSLPLILFPDGRPLSVGKNGTYLDDNGHSLVHIDENGRPVISADGTPLQKTNAGRYLYPYESQKKKASSVNAGDDDHLLRTEPDREVQLNGRSESLDGFGRSSPEDEHGNYRWSMETTTGTWISPSSVCVINSNVDMLLILDASSSIRVVDYRIMKNFITNFLINYFNLQRNYVRVGVMKYGEKVEVPVSLGDYDSQTELLSKISETRRMHGEAHLGQALLDAAGEFLIFGSKDIPRIVIIFSNGQSRDNLKENARLLREDTKAYVFLVDVGNQGNNPQNLAIVGESNSHRIITIDGWHKASAEILDPFLDELCKLLPQRQDKTSRDGTWPTRKIEMRVTTPARICSQVDFQADIIFVLDSSDSITSEEYANLKETISMLIDEIFDLSPDIVRVGFIEYSDKASVPVPLGYYENKVQLLADISNSEQLGGMPIILRGLRAAREQFQRHSRDGVPKILVLVTSGSNRGNVALAANNLRKHLNVSIFVLVMNTSQGAQMMLNRLTGDEYSRQRVISIPGTNKLQQSELLQIGQALCGSTNMATATILPPQETPHRTTKRDTSFAKSKYKDDKTSRLKLQQWKTTTRHFAPIPLCKDGFLRPYQLSIIIDNSARSPEKDFRLVLNHVANFLKMWFTPESGLMQGDEISPKLGRGIDEAMLLAKEHAVRGVIQIILIISADGTSSDDAIQSAEYARDQYGQGVVTISIRAPSSELLKELSLGSPTRVIHFSDWSIGNELFHSWIAHAFCSYVSAPVMRKAKSTRMTRPPIRKTCTN